jgi:hypothetical protein
VAAQKSPAKFVLMTLLAGAVGVLAGPARADGLPLDGRWRQGPLKEDFTVQGWLAGCGPAPQSGSTGGGEIVQVRTEGDELAILGAGRVFRTNQCYDVAPNLVRDSHSRESSGKSFRTRCTTPATDPRRVLLQTLVTVSGDNRIELRETGRYEVNLADGHCIADIVRSRSFELVERDGANVAPAATPAPTVTEAPKKPEPATPKPAVNERCEAPGEPARLEVRPSRKLLRVGEHFDFRAVVVDEGGCPTKSPATWAIATKGDGKVSVDANGRVTAQEGAALGPVEILVSAAGRSTRVTVDVTTAARYDELLSRSGLNASGETDTASVTSVEGSHLGGSAATAEDGGRSRRNTFVAIVGVALAVLGALLVVFWRRGQKAKALEEKLAVRHEERLRNYEQRKQDKMSRYEAQMREHEESLRKVAEAKELRAKAELSTCPSCKREFSGDSRFCPHDGSALVAGSVPVAPSRMCPACGRAYAAGTTKCVNDGEELVPFAPGAKVEAPRPVAHTKICPRCGDRFAGGAAFCGKDGSSLVLIN